MSRLGVALRALEANRSTDDYDLLVDTRAPVPGADMGAHDQLVRQHPEFADDLTEIFTVAAAAERSEHLDEDRLDMLCRPKDVLAPAHGLSERTEWGVVLGLGLAAVLLFVLSVFVDTPTVDTFPRHTTTQEVIVRSTTRP